MFTGSGQIFSSSFLLLNITRWVIDFRKQGIEGLKPKKRARPSSMTKGFKSLYTNSAGKIKTDKEKSTEKIDGVIVMVSNEV